MAKTKIVIISDNNLDLLGGERESQLIIINCLKKLFDVFVIQPGVVKSEINGVRILNKTKSKRMKQLFKNPFAAIAYFFKVAKLIKTINPCIVHSNSQVSFFMVSLMKRFRLIPRSIKLIHTERGLFTKYSRFIKWIFGFSFKYADVLITTTNFNLQKWSDYLKKKHINIRTIVIENTAGPIYENIDVKRLNNNKYLTIGFAGRYCDWKNWPLAEKICERINACNCDARFIMYVSCLDKKATGKCLAFFKRMNNAYGERFCGKINVPFVEMEQFYYDIDFFILTSKKGTESFGRTLVEAMSRKTIVLSTDAGGATEVVGNSAYIFEDADGFAKYINYLSKKPEEMENIKNCNLNRARKLYSLKNNEDKYLNLYRSLAGTK